MRFRASVAIAAVVGLASACLGGLSEATPTRETIAFWRISIPAPASTPNWLQTQATGTFLRGAGLFDDDPATATLARVSAWASMHGMPNTGAALTSTPDVREARAKVVAEAIEKHRGRIEEFKKQAEAVIAARKEIQERRKNEPAPKASSPGEAEEKLPEFPPLPVLELPKRPPKPMALEVILRDSTRTLAEILQEASGLPVDAASEPTQIAGVMVRSLTSTGWVRPLLWAEVRGRLVLATDDRALRFAISESPADGDVLREDWSAQRSSVADERKNAKPAASILINYNAIRQDLGDEWEVSFASRLLTAWKMPNLRSISLHASVREPSAETANVPMILLDACWSAKSDAPGQSMRAGLTLDKAPLRQSAALVPDADVIMVIRPMYRGVADWVFRTYMADVSASEEISMSVLTSWRYWLGDHRKVLNEVGEGFGGWCMLALRKLADPSAPPVIHFRSSIRSGVSCERMIAGLATLCKPVGVEESKSDGSSSVWSVPVKSGWLDGKVGWAAAQSFGVPIIVGNVSFGEFDLVPSVRYDVEHADPEPRMPRKVPTPALPASPPAKPESRPESKPESKPDSKP